MASYKFPATVNSSTYTLLAGNSFYKTRTGSVLGIVLHVTAGLQDLNLVGTDGSAEGTAKWAIGRDVSWHVGVDSDSIRPCLPASYTGWHAKGYNSRTVGIEISNLDARWDNKPAEWVTRTLRNAAKACAAYVDAYDLPLQLASKATVDSAVANGRRFGFTYHSYVSKIRVDPGKTFPWARFIAMVKEELGQAPKPPTSPSSPFYCERGDEGTAVKRVQTIVKVTADGSFGPGTEAAVKAWQASKKILVDGKWGPVTEQTYQNSLVVVKPPVVTPPTTTPAPTNVFCKRGDSGAAVKRVQSIVGVTPDGVFGPGTENAVKTWQHRFAGYPNGVWDAPAEAVYQYALRTKQTWFQLPPGHWYGRDDGTPNSHSGKTPADIANIKRIQTDIGVPADGSFGPGTEAAVKTWQASLKIPVTGRVDTRTWARFIIA